LRFFFNWRDFAKKRNFKKLKNGKSTDFGAFQSQGRIETSFSFFSWLLSFSALSLVGLFLSHG
jgi:hypothetical protein